MAEVERTQAVPAIGLHIIGDGRHRPSHDLADLLIRIAWQDQADRLATFEQPAVPDALHRDWDDSQILRMEVVKGR